VTGKGGRVRRVPLRADLAEALAAWSGDGAGWLFPGAIDGHVSPDWVGRVLARTVAGWSAHTLRHAAATRWYQASRDLLAVQALLGHSRPETTVRYVLLDNDALRAVIDA